MRERERERERKCLQCQTMMDDFIKYAQGEEGLGDSSALKIYLGAKFCVFVCKQDQFQQIIQVTDMQVRCEVWLACKILRLCTKYSIFKKIA